MHADYHMVPNTYEDWRHNESRDFQPTARQSAVIEAVSAALTGGLHYTKDVRAFCARYLEITPEVDEHPSGRRVEGGEFGMDCYYARRTIDARNKHAAEDAAAAGLRLVPGLELGSLIFTDCKLTTRCKVESIEGAQVSFSGKRGRYTVTGKATALGLRHAMERAHRGGKRRDSFEAFAAKRAAAAPVAPPVSRELAIGAGQCVTTLRGELDSDDGDEERHTPPGTVGRLVGVNHTDADGVTTWDLVFPSGAWVCPDDKELRDPAQYTLGPVPRGPFRVLIDHEQSAGEAPTFGEARRLARKLADAEPLPCTFSIEDADGIDCGDVGRSNGRDLPAQMRAFETTRDANGPTSPARTGMQIAADLRKILDA